MTVFFILILQIYNKYKNLPIGMHISSFKAPRIEIKPTGIHFYIYARVLFRVKNENNEIINLFGINFVSYFSSIFSPISPSHNLYTCWKFLFMLD